MHRLSLLIISNIHIPGSEDQVKIVDDSIKRAKEAIALDVKDGNSWCKC